MAAVAVCLFVCLFCCCFVLFVCVGSFVCSACCILKVLTGFVTTRVSAGTGVSSGR